MTTEPSREPRSRRRWWIGGLVIAVLVVVVLAPLASSDPDGLERVAEDLGFIDRAENVVGGLLGDYAIPGIEDPAVSTIVSGLLGIAIVVLVIFGIGRLLARRRA
jgi:ABC-type Fe3+ transport system permease subunit